MKTDENGHFGPLLATATPFLLAIVFVVMGNRPAPATTAISPPPLAFAEYVVNMGPYPVQPRPIALARFRFTNRSDTDIEFMKETPSCGCLSPGLEKKIWAPGETGDLYMRVQTAGQKPGPHEYTLHLEYGPPGSDVERRSEAMLTYKVVFPEQKITVEPRSLLVYQLGNKSVEREIVISDMRGDTLQIESIKTMSPYVTAKKIGERIDESGAKKFTLSVTVSGSVPAGDSRALVNVQTNDRRFLMLQIPVLIRGPQRPEKLAIHAQPELMVLTPSKDKSKLIGELQLISATGKPLKVRSIRADPPVIQAAHVDDARNPGSIKVSAFVTNEQLLGFNRGMLTIETEEPGHSRIEIPVMLRGLEKTTPPKTAQRPVGPPTR